MKKTLPITVAIPSMNRPQALRRTLQGYLGADHLPAQIIVVDQSQTEQAQAQNKQLLATLPVGVTGTYVYQKNSSSTQARNTALQQARQNIIVWSDDDVDVYADTLKNVYDLFQNPQISMIAGLDDCAAKSTGKIGYLLGTKSFFKRKIGHVTASMLGRFPAQRVKGEVDTQWAMGFFFSVRTPLLKKWNIKWDENLTGYAYAEDLDFSYSYYKCAKKEGYRCILSDKVHVKHLASQEYRIPSKKATYMYVCNRYYLAHKHSKGIKIYEHIFAMWWCNMAILLYRFVKKQNPHDMWNAIYFCLGNSSQIKRGYFNYDSKKQ